MTVEVDLSTPSGSGRAADAPDAPDAPDASDAPGPSDAPSGMERVTVSPLTAEAVNGPDGSDLESSFMVNTGEGLAWTMDWSPVDPDGSSLLAVGCHPPGSSDSLHELTELCTKKDAVIQIWRVSGAGREGKVEPLVNLVHEGGVTWSVCWCPTPQALNGRMGLLAAVLGDGTVCVWDVPKLDPPGAVGGSGVQQPQLTCRAAPVAEIGPASVDGSIPCTVDWLPHEPFDLLLVGYRDGCVSIVQLADAASDRMHIKQYFPAEALTLTAAKWFPSELHDGHKEVDDGAERRTFVTCGQESAINIAAASTRQPKQPPGSVSGPGRASVPQDVRAHSASTHCRTSSDPAREYPSGSARQPAASAGASGVPAAVSLSATACAACSVASA